MRIIQVTINAAMISGLCQAQARDESGLLSRAAVIQANVAVCLKNNDVDGLHNVQQQISALERCVPPREKDSKPHLEAVARSYLKLFQATKEIMLPADQYEEYVVGKQGYNMVKPMRHPEAARAIAFPGEETLLITNAVLRQELNQYRAAKRQREDNMQRKRVLESIRFHVLGYFKGVGHELSKGEDTQASAQLRQQINELVRSANDRNAILELFPPKQENLLKKENPASQ
jgi:hypothetical protein